MRRLFLAAVLLTCPLAVRAAESKPISPKDAGEIQAKVGAKEAEIRKQYGNKKDNELTADERREMGDKIRAGREEVLQKNGTNSKDYEWATRKMGKEEQQEIAASKVAAEKKMEEDAKKAQEKKDQGAQEVQVQRGFDDQHPVVTDGKGAGEAVDQDEAGAAKQMDVGADE